jgi:hypothetical protein
MPRVPEVTPDTVRVVVEMDPVTTAALGRAVRTTVPRVWELLTMYLPVPPAPLSSAVMTVPAETPEPVRLCLPAAGSRPAMSSAKARAASISARPLSPSAATSA